MLNFFKFLFVTFVFCVIFLYYLPTINKEIFVKKIIIINVDIIFVLAKTFLSERLNTTC